MGIFRGSPTTSLWHLNNERTNQSITLGDFIDIADGLFSSEKLYIQEKTSISKGFFIRDLFLLG
jgi:hypothetical protein